MEKFAITSLAAFAVASEAYSQDMEADDEKDGISMQKYLACVKHFTDVKFKD